MEINDSNVAMLSNFEVLSLLKELPPNTKRTNAKSQLATITYETIKYLEATPANQQTLEIVQDCLESLHRFDLTKAETVMLLNNPPTSALEIQLMIEESEERLTDEQVDELLKEIETKIINPTSTSESDTENA